LCKRKDVKIVDAEGNLFLVTSEKDFPHGAEIWMVLLQRKNSWSGIELLRIIVRNYQVLTEAINMNEVISNEYRKS
jgi:hypothetical protein